MRLNLFFWMPAAFFSLQEHQMMTLFPAGVDYSSLLFGGSVPIFLWYWATAAVGPLTDLATTSQCACVSSSACIPFLFILVCLCVFVRAYVKALMGLVPSPAARFPGSVHNHTQQAHHHLWWFSGGTNPFQNKHTAAQNQTDSTVQPLSLSSSPWPLWTGPHFLHGAQWQQHAG